MDSLTIVFLVFLLAVMIPLASFVLYMYLKPKQEVASASEKEEMLSNLIAAILNRQPDFDSQRKTVRSMAEEYSARLNGGKGDLKGSASVIQLFDRRLNQDKIRKL